MTVPQHDPVETARMLTTALNRVSGRLDEVKEASEERDARLEKDGRRNRLLLYADVGLTIAVALLGFFLTRANTSADTASASAATATARAAAVNVAQQTLHTALIQGCELTNARYANQLVFWDYLFATAKGKPTAQLARFEGLVKTAFAPRDCQKAYSITPQPRETPHGSR